MSQTIDVTGLSPDAVRSVEQFIASLREQAQSPSSLTGAAAPGGDPWEDAAVAQRSLQDYDFSAVSQQRAFDQHHGQDHLK